MVQIFYPDEIFASMTASVKGKPVVSGHTYPLLIEFTILRDLCMFNLSISTAVNLSLIYIFQN